MKRSVHTSCIILSQLIKRHDSTLCSSFIQSCPWRVQPTVWNACAYGKLWSGVLINMWTWMLEVTHVFTCSWKSISKGDHICFVCISHEQTKDRVRQGSCSKFRHKCRRDIMRQNGIYSLWKWVFYLLLLCTWSHSHRVVARGRELSWCCVRRHFILPLSRGGHAHI